jgi:hypothetical protein
MLGATSAAACPDPFATPVAYGAATFVQTRHLAGVRAPLVSRGRAVIAANRVEWRVMDPVEVVTTITADGVAQSVGGAAPTALGGQGAGFVSTTGLVDLLRGDFAALRTHYLVARSARADGAWIVRLTPRAESLARFVSRIEVRGCEAVREVDVRQANGDRMAIALTPIGE